MRAIVDSFDGLDPNQMSEKLVVVPLAVCHLTEEVYRFRLRLVGGRPDLNFEVAEKFNLAYARNRWNIARWAEAAFMSREWLLAA